MLKRLELVGFKSFADRTWFSFPAGLTAIVGPNGSGKSNVVDAVKWILGEQSAKSLRGGEMADVIFNGSSSRRALGVAEVTLTLDNPDRQLNTDAAEISVTRRVHRDGTGEYLINGQQSRLKDVRELFLGSGAGSTAYCIIEQGRVDALLQASSRDRRAIFEEAAGISRFKAKKQEALRKLEHTAENLTRLRDIFGEVEARLRRVRLDAEKARKFQEYGGRLRELRLGIALREYHCLTERLTVETTRLDSVRGELTASAMQVAVWEAEGRQLEESLGGAEIEIAQATEGLSDAHRRIAALRERLTHEADKATETDGELAIARRKSVELALLVRGLQSAADGSRAEVAAAEGETEVRRARVVELDAVVSNVETELVTLRRQVHDGRDRQFHLVGRAAALNSEAASARAQLDKLQRERDRRRRESEGKTAELASVERVLDGLGRKDTDLQTRIALARQALADRRGERDNLRTQADRLVELLEGQRVRQGGLTGRIDVLENLERSQEGLGTGVRELLAELSSGSSPLSGAVIGLVADWLRVPADLAPLIDVVLGDVASHFVVRDSVVLDLALADRNRPFTGRVGFLPLLRMEAAGPGDDLATADRGVTSDHPDLAGLPRQLLGRTLVVGDLTTARRMSGEQKLAGFRFVTRAGELLASDGTIIVGPARSGAGIVSRKSELRELRSQAAQLDREIGETERRLTDLRDLAESLAGPIHGLEDEIRALTSNVADLQTEMLKQSQHRLRLTDDIALVRQEWEMLEEELQRLEAFWRETRGKATEAESEADALRAQLEAADHAIRGYEHDRTVRQQEQTAARVAMAETAERLNSLRAAHAKLEADLDRGRGEAIRMARHEGVLVARIAEIELSGLRASAGLANAFGSKESLERQVTAFVERRDADRARRAKLVLSLQAARTESQQAVEQVHAHELTVRDLAAARDRTTDRLREDYQLDLAAEYAACAIARGEADAVAWDALAASKEVDDLRKKIRHLGNVSLEALAELAEVETRSNDLQAQITDLTEAEQSLRAVIGKINEDSRKLFVDTYEAVRAHFQELFRKLFGGGMADVILETPDDVLETGVEIVARPPGKELRSISLMSGGEKTLTAVALLLAIFRSKPSPFCLLDEVDAALDEANTERLAKTIHDFTDRSQFIVITHKKRTMAYADVLYGVTMQESGISKQIAVRFDDWPQDEALRTRAA
jgi:chromosome segregation protein